MLYNYMIMADATKVTHSSVEKNSTGNDVVRVIFERTRPIGIEPATLEIELPSYKVLHIHEIDKHDLRELIQFTHNNAAALWRFAQGGGVHNA